MGVFLLVLVLGNDQKSSKFWEDSKNLYIIFVRSQLEQSAVVWHSCLTEENIHSLERVQKSAPKIIMGEKYQSYKKSLIFF